MRVDELHNHLHLVARALHAALKDVCHAQFGGDLFQIAALRLTIGENRCARDRFEIVDFRQRRDHFVVNPVGEKLVFLVRAEVRERQHGD